MTLNELDFEDGLMDPINEEDPQNQEEETKEWMEPEKEDGPIEPEPPEEENDEDILTKLLKSNGINPDSVKIQNEEGEIEEVNFYDLSPEEQLDLLHGPVKEDTSLEDDEISFINHLRDNNLSINDYLEYYRKQVIEDYQNNIQDNTTYDIDSFSDDELFIADLKDKIPDLTDEEASQQLNIEKQNEALFTKKMQGIRTQLKEREKLAMEQAQQEAQAEADKQAAAYEDMIVEAIKENDSISRI